MRAAVVELPNDPGALRDVPVPVAAANEILVRVRAASINPIDWKSRDRGDRPLPFTLGQDFAGVVVSLGAGVSDYAVDDRVFGNARDHGAYADFTVASVNNPEQPISKIPASLSDTVAAALPTAGLTALACVERLGATDGKLLFIVGVSGTVGEFAAQIARSRGARVAGSGGAASSDVAGRLGLDAYIAFDRGNVIDEVRKRYPDGVDVLLDLADDADDLKKVSVVVRRGGTIGSTIRSVDEAFAKEHGLVGLNVNLYDSPQSSRDGLDRLAALVADGTVKPPPLIERSLNDAVEAIEARKARKITGKIVLVT